MITSAVRIVTVLVAVAIGILCIDRTEAGVIPQHEIVPTAYWVAYPTLHIIAIRPKSEDDGLYKPPSAAEDGSYKPSPDEQKLLQNPSNVIGIWATSNSGSDSNDGAVDNGPEESVNHIDGNESDIKEADSEDSHSGKDIGGDGATERSSEVAPVYEIPDEGDLTISADSGDEESSTPLITTEEIDDIFRGRKKRDIMATDSDGGDDDLTSEIQKQPETHTSTPIKASKCNN